MKISRSGILKYLKKNHEIFETFKLEHFIPHLYKYVHEVLCLVIVGLQVNVIMFIGIRANFFYGG